MEYNKILHLLKVKIIHVIYKMYNIKFRRAVCFLFYTSLGNVNEDRDH